MQFLQSDKDKAEGRYSSVSGQKVCSCVVLIAVYCMRSCLLLGFMLNQHMPCIFGLWLADQDEG